MKIKYLLFFTLLSCISLSQASVSYPDNDTVTDYTKDSIKVFTADMASADIDNNYILDMLDSLVAAKFFVNYEFTDDSSILNVYNFPPDSIRYINCHNPFAPARELAVGFNADSTTVRYFNSSGILYLSRYSSNNGKYTSDKPRTLEASSRRLTE